MTTKDAKDSANRLYEKKTRKWFHVCDNLNLPLNETKFGFIRSIAFEERKSNRENTVYHAKGSRDSANMTAVEEGDMDEAWYEDGEDIRYVKGKRRSSDTASVRKRRREIVREEIYNRSNASLRSIKQM